MQNQDNCKTSGGFHATLQKVNVSMCLFTMYRIVMKINSVYPNQRQKPL